MRSFQFLCEGSLQIFTSRFLSGFTLVLFLVCATPTSSSWANEADGADTYGQQVISVEASPEVNLNEGALVDQLKTYVAVNRFRVRLDFQVQSSSPRSEEKIWNLVDLIVYHERPMTLESKFWTIKDVSWAQIYENDQSLEIRFNDGFVLVYRPVKGIVDLKMKGKKTKSMITKSKLISAADYFSVSPQSLFMRRPVDAYIFTNDELREADMRAVNYFIDDSDLKKWVRFNDDRDAHPKPRWNRPISRRKRWQSRTYSCRQIFR